MYAFREFCFARVRKRFCWRMGSQVFLFFVFVLCICIFIMAAPCNWARHVFTLLYLCCCRSQVLKEGEIVTKEAYTFLTRELGATRPFFGCWLDVVQRVDGFIISPAVRIRDIRRWLQGCGRSRHEAGRSGRVPNEASLIPREALNGYLSTRMEISCSELSKWSRITGAE
jgi:hypothetical protein